MRADPACINPYHVVPHQLCAQSEAIDLAKVLETNFRFAMGRLVYMYERSNDDVRGQISLILSFLRKAPFISTVRQHMLTMIDEYVNIKCLTFDLLFTLYFLLLSLLLDQRQERSPFLPNVRIHHAELLFDARGKPHAVFGCLP